MDFCKGDLNKASQKIYADFAKLSLTELFEEHDMKFPRFSRKTLAKDLLEQLQKACSKEEAVKFTEETLNVYKSIF